MSWNGSIQSNASSTSEKKSVVKPGLALGRGAIAGGIAVAVGVLAVFFMMSGEEPQAESKLSKSKVIGAAEPVSAEHVMAPAGDAVTVSQRKKRESLRDMLKSMTPEERANYQWEKFKSEPLDLSVPSNRVFATGTEQIMAWIFTTELGSLPPPLPMIPTKERAHFAEILLSDNVVNNNDSETAADAKEMVALAKKELIEYIKKGGEIDDFFEYYRGQLVQAHQEREDCRKAAIKVMKEDPDIAAEYINQINERLEAKGIKRIDFHPKMKAHFGVSE